MVGGMIWGKGRIEDRSTVERGTRRYFRGEKNILEGEDLRTHKREGERARGRGM